MLEILIKIVERITDILLNHEIIKDRKKKKYYRTIVKQTLNYSDLLEELHHFIDAINIVLLNSDVEELKSSTYEVRRILDCIVNQYDEIYNLIRYDDPKLAYTTDLLVASKLNIFEYWKVLGNQSIWAKDGDIYIPNYSVLLSDNIKISELSIMELKHLEQIFSESTGQFLYFDNKDSKILSSPMQKYVPAPLQAIITDLRNKEYVKLIKLPQDKHYLQEIVKITKKEIVKIEKMITRFKEIINTYAQKSDIDLVDIVFSNNKKNR